VKTGQVKQKTVLKPAVLH